MRSLYSRRFCLSCSPFGIHNTSKNPPGVLEAPALVEVRRRRRNAKTYRYQKKRRKALKGELVAARGGRCFDCGHAGILASLDFHHRDPAEKEFAISHFGGAYRRLVAEVEKCDLVCANCHRIRHATEDARIEPHPVVAWRRRTKQRAVEFMGSACQACGATGPTAIFDFHHRNAGDKDFAISQDGIPRRWETIVAELAKCVMLCANCHREVHAGMRTLDDAQPALAEEALEYAA